MQLVLQEAQAAKAYNLGPISHHLTTGLHVLSGKNGSGKSTLLKLIAGVIPLTAGSITLIKLEKEYDSSCYKSRIGYASQEIAVYDEMRVVDYLRYVGRMKLIPSELLADRIEQVINELQIKAWSLGIIDKLSMGQKRMLMFAHSILADPDILLLDESLESLDIEQQQHLIGILHRLAKHAIILVTSHRNEQWKDHASQFIELREGKLIPTIWM
jgi:ABC-2 type transport system ATP-binding protein